MKLLVPHPSEVVPDKSAREKFATSFHDRVHKADSTLKHDIGSESIFCSTKNITEGLRTLSRLMRVISVGKQPLQMLNQHAPNWPDERGEKASYTRTEGGREGGRAPFRYLTRRCSSKGRRTRAGAPQHVYSAVACAEIRSRCVGRNTRRRRRRWRYAYR